MQQLSVESYMVHHFPKIEQFPHTAKKLLFCGMKKLFHENQINEFLVSNRNKDALSFIEAIIDYFDVTIGLKKDEMTRIPSYGRTVIIANHPLGALDALALIHLLKDVRKDIKIVANSFLGQFDNLKDILIPVDNINGKMDRQVVTGIYQALEEEKAVIIFPSGEVSRARPNGVKDTKWKNGFLKIATKMKAPILPIYIKAKNSKSFYMLSMINRSLATATLPHEMFKGRGKQIDFTIGRSIPYESYNIPLPTNEKVKLLRKHFYKIAKSRRELFKTENPISMAETPSEIKKELKNGTLLGETLDGKSIILYESTQENCVIKEIGRLREISFRFVGEGSGKKRDIDGFDFYYKHLIIWDNEHLEIAGAYRLGVTGEIVEDFDIDGLYSSSLFKYHEGFEPQLASGIELGRSFVQPKYWNSRALDYLWQGIGAFVKSRPDIRYLFGAVSMSDSFNEKAKALMIYFYSHYFAGNEVMVTHKNPYYLSSEMKAYCDSIFKGDDYKGDQRVLKEELGYMGYMIPTLYKQYAEVCDEDGVKFLDFGYDKDFNNCIDGFIVVDLHKMKESKKKRYIG
ncbi:lysophospholipid acyltransferase family protein [Sulfurovum sp. zt1-1]|uniref:Lysophospholipid acyltransferase family protein n=1 Tax=Sulfurovum zhangzhouensis TaxID=3019067 RepID=A0ABT7QXG7_9BACT|nr:lysophospholipid acyltransferase family protein [Sulfurovum zhangzhouensis]MDM5271526.1 lysophospholipid acyltransferase family protein [Sulfurovum zhangzhouensis]